MSNECAVPECGQPVRSRGYCGVHYRRWRLYGDPNTGRTNYRNPAEAFAAHTQREGGHLMWTAAIDQRGYGRMWDGRRMVAAHRFSWELENGTIPDGLEVDHECHVRACVDPAHLRLATRKQNNANRSGAAMGRALPRGVYPNGRGYSAQVHHHGHSEHLGTFPTPERAAAVAAARRLELFGEYAGKG